MPCQRVKHLACSSSPGVSNMKFREIKEKYRRKAKLSGSLILLNENDALSFIDECSTLGLKLLGVEGVFDNRYWCISARSECKQRHSRHSNAK